MIDPTLHFHLVVVFKMVKTLKDYARPGTGHRSQGNTTAPILVVGSGQIITENETETD